MVEYKTGGWDCKEAVKRERKRLMALLDRQRVEWKDCNENSWRKRRNRDRIQRNTGVHSWFTRSHAGTSSKAASHFSLLVCATVLIMSEAKLLSLPHHWKCIWLNMQISSHLVLPLWFVLLYYTLLCWRNSSLKKKKNDTDNCCFFLLRNIFC